MSTDCFISRMGAAMGTDAPGNTVKVVIGFVGLMLIASATPMAHSLSLDDEKKRVPIEELKRVYLSCDREAISGQLSAGGIMNCSIVYEELKRRAFGGDFDKFLAWSSAKPSEQQTGL